MVRVIELVRPYLAPRNGRDGAATYAFHSCAKHPPPPKQVVGGRRLHPSLQEAMLLRRSYRSVLKMAFAGGLPITSGDTHA